MTTEPRQGGTEALTRLISMAKPYWVEKEDAVAFAGTHARISTTITNKQHPVLRIPFITNHSFLFVLG